ncbi:PssE/Cps14G family polysaccharide biosynthesis glycosyltransferase [Geobacter sp.]|uniref:PssE/Cps14G family polysaccharide biosynthesis glycosyltransferase n=1 Tax=Geobacter sp. TaxID=46610 RepID=UPI0027BA122E|nr:PssE/Cps14G family polysaccharide biosynthesis glycosyltransferase [Geobacter sp.]
MIFVTIGTTLVFDDLIEAIDNLVEDGIITEPVVCQIGNSGYVPKHCEYFRFQPNIDEWTAKASLVICHGGTGSVLSLLTQKRPFIAVANPRGAEDHQAQFLERLSRSISILWTRDLNGLSSLIEKARTFEPKPLDGERLVDDLRKYLNSV